MYVILGWSLIILCWLLTAVITALCIEWIRTR